MSPAPDGPATADPSGILAVVVIFERDLGQVLCWPWLTQLLQVQAPRADTLCLRHVLVYDNSPSPRARPVQRLLRCSYVHDPLNGGTAAAYQRAADLAGHLGLGWLLLLDQDSSLPADYLQMAGSHLRTEANAASVLVPWVADRGRAVSPAVLTIWGGLRPLRQAAAPSGKRLSAIASGCLIRITALRALLPFPRALWLDYVDHWMFARLQSSGGQVSVFDAHLEHRLSVLSPAELSPRRLRSILDGERHFLRLQGALARLVYPLRLLMRIGRYALIRPRLAAAALDWIGSRGGMAC